MFDPYNPPPPPKYTASYQATGLMDEVIVPGLKALILGVFGGFTVGMTMHLLHRSGYLAELSAWKAGLTATGALTGWLFLRFSERAHYMIERLTGADLNLDGYIGQPPPVQVIDHRPPLRVEVIEDGGRHIEFIDLPYPDKVAQLAPALASGVTTFSLDSCAPILNRNEFGELRTIMLERNLARWKNPNSPKQGCELTGAGRAMMRRIATQGNVQNYLQDGE